MLKKVKALPLGGLKFRFILLVMGKKVQDLRFELSDKVFID